jgi:predicted NACHT family NTPase
MLLVLGDAGAGKTLAMYALAQELDKLQQKSDGWVTVRVELSQLTAEDLNTGITHVLMVSQKLTMEQVQQLQQCARVLIILEGVDELRPSDRELRSISSEARTIFPKAHFIATLRTGHMADTAQRSVFGFGGELLRRFLLPFSKAQITQYVEMRTAASAEERAGAVTEGRIRSSKNKKKAAQLLSAQEYQEHFQRSPQLLALARRPFVLRLLLEALVDLLEQADGDPHEMERWLTRFDIFNAFLRGWMERELNKLPTTADITVPEFLRFQRKLAFLMYREGTLSVRLSRGTSKSKADQRAFAAWQQLEKTVYDTHLATFERNLSQLSLKVRK